MSNDYCMNCRHFACGKTEVYTVFPSNYYNLYYYCKQHMKEVNLDDNACNDYK
jgi:hypothetical protein